MDRHSAFFCGRFDGTNLCFRTFSDVRPGSPSPISSSLTKPSPTSLAPAVRQSRSQYEGIVMVTAERKSIEKSNRAEATHNEKPGLFGISFAELWRTAQQRRSACIG